MSKQHLSTTILLRTEELYKRHSYTYRMARHSTRIYQLDQKNQLTLEETICRKEGQVSTRLQEKDTSKRQVNI